MGSLVPSIKDVNFRIALRELFLFAAVAIFLLKLILDHLSDIIIEWLSHMRALLFLSSYANIYQRTFKIPYDI